MRSTSSGSTWMSLRPVIASTAQRTADRSSSGSYAMYSLNQRAGRPPWASRTSSSLASSARRIFSCRRRKRRAPSLWSPRSEPAIRSRLDSHHFGSRSGRGGEQHDTGEPLVSRREPNRDRRADRVADDRDSLRVDSLHAAKREQCRGRVVGLPVEARREVLTLRLTNATLVESERGDATLGEAVGKRGGNVERLAGHVRVAVERPRPLSRSAAGTASAASGSATVPTRRTPSSVAQLERSLEGCTDHRMHPCGRSSPEALASSARTSWMRSSRAATRSTVVDDLSTGRRENVNPAAPPCRARHPRAVRESRADPNSLPPRGAGRRRHLGRAADLRRRGQRHRPVACPGGRGRAGAQVVFTSTGGAIYGECARPAREDDPREPFSPYGTSKLAGEEYLATWNRLHGTRHVALRLANVYGPRQLPTLEGGVIAIFLNRMGAGEETIVYGDGLQSRDFVHVGDVARALLAAVGATPGVYNIGTGVDTRIVDLHALCRRATGTEGDPTFADPRPGEILRSVLDPSAAERELGWRAEVGLEEGLRKTWEESEGQAPK